MKKLMAALSGLFFVVGLAGCNTMSGLGQDIDGGEKLERSAEKNKRGS